MSFISLGYERMDMRAASWKIKQDVTDIWTDIW